MTWLSLIGAVLSAVVAVLGYLKDRQPANAATAEAVAGHLKGALDEIAKANAKRDAVRSDTLLHPERLRDDDGFRRD